MQSTSQHADFSARVHGFVDGAARDAAMTNFRTYMDTFTGRHFEAIADRDPNRITANDLVAVTMLSVQVPAEASWSVLTDGADEISALLHQIDPSLEIWDEDADLSPTSPSWKLWTAIAGQKGVGRTIASKLLAAKRPRLFPIYDSVVGTALGISDENFWDMWQQLLREDAELRTSVDEIRAGVPAAAHLSTLRMLDIVIWMAAPKHPAPA
jgi:hypothetical protein